MRTVAIMNQKGGCGKTTTAVNLAGALARRGRPTLLVDLDPQSHCAAGLSIPEHRIDLSSADLLLAGGDEPIQDARLLWSAARGLDVAPSTVKLAGLEAPRGGLADKPDRDLRLEKALARLADRYEFCVIDCSPSIGLLTFNALRAADETIIPVETGFLSMHGAERQVQTIRSVGRRLGGQTPFAILPTMHNPESSLARSVLAELRRAFGDRVIPTPIRLDVKLREAVSFGQPIVEYAPTSWGAHDYSELASWLEQRTLAGPPTYADPGDDIVIRATGPRAPEASPLTPEAIDRARAARRAAVALETETSGSGSSTATHTTSDRARDLADRARRLLSRSAEIQERISKARGVHLAPEPESPDVPRASRRPTELYGVRETSRGALFVHPADRDAEVCVAADFNGWSATAHPLRYNQTMGVHEAMIDLSAGVYEYRLVVDGRWIADPFNPDISSNPYGGTNSRFVMRGLGKSAAIALVEAEGSD